QQFQEYREAFVDASEKAMTDAPAKAENIQELYKSVSGDEMVPPDTTAAEMDTLRGIVRATFAEMYADDVLADITEHLIGQLPIELYKKLPPLPKPGNFNIDQVLNADYFIS
ncbi:hypothetical protein EBT31_18710, partial [bacterium]|nr:hypothetical protein [bacterium]